MEEAVESEDPKTFYKDNAEAHFMVEDPKTKKQVLMQFAGGKYYSRSRRS